MCNPSGVSGRYHHGQLREAILTASRELLAESGAGGLSLRAAARRAGVSTAAPYRHFKDKQSLLVALACAAFLRLDAELADIARSCAAQACSALDTVAALGVGYVGFAARCGPEFRLMFGELAPAPSASEELEAATAAVSGHLSRAIEALLVEAAAAGTPSEDLPPASGLILLAWSVVHGLSTLHLDGHLQRFAGGDAQAVTAHIVGLLAAALRGQLLALDR